MPDSWLTTLGQAFPPTDNRQPPATFGTSPFATHFFNALQNILAAPGQALQSTTPITSDQMIAPAANLAGLVTLGAGAMPAEVNSLRAGIRMRPSGPEYFPENISAPRAANDPAVMSVERGPNYDAAVRQQRILRGIDENTEIGSFDYWQKIAEEEGHKIGSFPNGYKAAKERSRDGKTTLLIDPEGRRVLFRDGQKAVAERYSDISPAK
jgi:hypothetical protein